MPGVDEARVGLGRARAPISALGLLRRSPGPRLLRSWLDERQLGELKRFEVWLGANSPLHDAPSTEHARGGLGVAAAGGPEVLDLLTWLLGEMELVAVQDDADGGPAAEARMQLSSPRGIQGVVRLSRLRDFDNRLIVEGAAGWARLDLNSLALSASRPVASTAARGERARGPGLMRRLKARGSNDDIAEPDRAARVLAAYAARRTRLVHPWETAEGPDPASPLLGKRVLVIGASGFVGSRVVERLFERHTREVGAIVRSANRSARIARFGLDLRERELHQITPADLAGYDVVINLAHDIRSNAARNLQGFERLLTSAQSAGVAHFIHASSIAAYDGWPDQALDEESPISIGGGPYKEAKAAAERRLCASGLSATILQPTIVYGAFSALWTDAIVERLAKGVVMLPNNADHCPAVFVDDVADAFIAAAGRLGQACERFIVSGPRPGRWIELFEAYGRAIGRPDAVHVFERSKAAPNAPSGLGRYLADPLSLAQIDAVRFALGAIGRAIGRDRLAALRAWVARQRPQSGPLVFSPAPHEMRLYVNEGAVSTAKARSQLGLQPRYHLAAGLERTSDYIRWRAQA